MEAFEKSLENGKSDDRRFSLDKVAEEGKNIVQDTLEKATKQGKQVYASSTEAKEGIVLGKVESTDIVGKTLEALEQKRKEIWKEFDELTDKNRAYREEVDLKNIDLSELELDTPEATEFKEEEAKLIEQESQIQKAFSYAAWKAERQKNSLRVFADTALSFMNRLIGRDFDKEMHLINSYMEDTEYNAGRQKQLDEIKTERDALEKKYSIKPLSLAEKNTLSMKKVLESAKSLHGPHLQQKTDLLKKEVASQKKTNSINSNLFRTSSN